MKCLLWVSSLLVALGASTARAGTCDVSKLPKLNVASPTDVTVYIANPPTTRMRVIFDSDDGEHRLVEWDPAVEPRVLQRIRLSKSEWRVTVTVEPTLIQQSGASMLISPKFDTPANNAGKVKIEGTYFALSTSQMAVASAAGSGAPPNVTFGNSITLSDFPHPTVELSCGDPKPTIDSLDFSATSGVPGQQRAFGTIPSAATEVLGLLAEIAIERAKSGALSLLKERLVDPLCGDKGVVLATLHLPGAGLAFPRSCELLQRLRLEDAMSSGKPLLRALRDDLRLTIAPAVIHKATGDTPWTRIVDHALVIVNHAIDQGSFSGLQTQAALLLLDDVSGLMSLGRIPSLTGDPLQAKLIGWLQTGLARSQFEQIARCVGPGTTGESCAAALLANVTLADLRVLATYVDLPNHEKFMELIEKWTPGTSTAGFATILAASLNHKVVELVPGCTGKDAPTCAAYLVENVETVGDLFDLAKRVAEANRPAIESAIVAWWQATAVTDPVLQKATAIACHARLAVAVVKSCTKTTCGTDQIQRMMKSPQDYFGVDTALPQSLCWKSGAFVSLDDEKLATFRDAVVQGIEVLSAATTMKGPERAITIVRLLFSIGRETAGCDDVGPSKRCSQMSNVEDIIVALLQEDYMLALTTATRMVKDNVHLPSAFLRGSELIGAIAAYAKVYEDTKDDDPKAAREARKKALESLIDSATDRHERGGKTIFSIGSNVSVSGVWNVGRNSMGDLGSDVSWNPQVRVPLGFALQVLPPSTSFGAGFHLGLQLADLGQFVATGEDGAVGDVRWDSFFSPGLELGALFGKAHAAFNITFHIEYAPALFEEGSDATGDHRAGALRFGFSAGYYVPFFDLN